MQTMGPTVQIEQRWEVHITTLGKDTQYNSVTSVDNKLFTCTFSCYQNLRIILTHPGKLECTLKIMCCTEKSTTLLVVIWRGCKYFSWFACNNSQHEK